VTDPRDSSAPGEDSPALAVVPLDVIDDRRDDDVHAVLAAQARGRAASELWTTAVGGAMNASILWWQFPSLRWLAAGFIAVAAYGIWGLADRDTGQRRGTAALLAIIRGVAVGVGWIAAIGAVIAFMAAALGGWQH
jgi:hypothetical protein